MNKRIARILSDLIKLKEHLEDNEEDETYLSIEKIIDSNFTQLEINKVVNDLFNDGGLVK